MSLNTILPFISTAIMLTFAASVFQRFVVRRAPHFLFWGIGLTMFGLASFSEGFLSLAWNQWVFFIWYLFGAVLTAAWIGHGTMYLLFRKKWVHALTVVLVAGSLGAGYLMLQALPSLDTSLYRKDRPISEQYATKKLKPSEAAPEGVQTATITYKGEEVTVTPGMMPLGTPVRSVTPFFNIYGTLTLVGGALWSAFLFWRKRVLPNRVIGNVLIAAGALIIASASTLTRFGHGALLYPGELLAAIFMFIGFLTAAAPQPGEEVVSPVPAPAGN